MKISKAIEGYLLDKQSSGYADSTIVLYRTYLPMIIKYLGDKEVTEVTSTDLKQYLLYLRKEYIPNRPGKTPSTKPLSPSAVDNHWKAVRSFFRWCNEALNISRPDSSLARPKFMLPEITSFTQQEVKALLKSCETTAETNDGKRSPFKRKRTTVNRDKAIILTLLDTGLRIGELCRLTMQDVDMTTGEVYVIPFGSGQKTKPRVVYIGKATKRAVWLYQADLVDFDKQDSVFGMSPSAIRQMLNRISKNANVHDCHPHRFRHSFAMTYLRSGGDVFTLKKLLGHQTLEMTQKYLSLVDADTETAHRKASPADNWKL